MLALVITCSALSVIIIILSLLMSGDSNSFSGALVGSNDLDLFKVSKERTGKKILKWLMYIFSAALIICAIAARAAM